MPQSKVKKKIIARETREKARKKNFNKSLCFIFLVFFSVFSVFSGQKKLWHKFRCWNF